MYELIGDVSFSDPNGEPSVKPAADRGAFSLLRSLTRQVTSSPRSSACRTASEPVPPDLGRK